MPGTTANTAQGIFQQLARTALAASLIFNLASCEFPSDRCPGNMPIGQWMIFHADPYSGHSTLLAASERRHGDTEAGAGLRLLGSQKNRQHLLLYSNHSRNGRFQILDCSTGTIADSMVDSVYMPVLSPGHTLLAHMTTEFYWRAGLALTDFSTGHRTPLVSDDTLSPAQFYRWSSETSLYYIGFLRATRETSVFVSEMRGLTTTQLKTPGAATFADVHINAGRAAVQSMISDRPTTYRVHLYDLRDSSVVDSWEGRFGLLSSNATKLVYADAQGIHLRRTDGTAKTLATGNVGVKDAIVSPTRRHAVLWGDFEAWWIDFERETSVALMESGVLQFPPSHSDHVTSRVLQVLFDGDDGGILIHIRQVYSNDC